MKYCSRRTYSYKGLSGAETTSHYVEEDDVLAFHGEQFTLQWLNFIKFYPKLKIDSKEVFYYDDYKFIALRTAQYLDLIN
jgi:hypothetical protein